MEFSVKTALACCIMLIISTTIFAQELKPLKIAVVYDKSDGANLADLITAQLSLRGISCLERSQIDQILKEQKLSQSNLFDPNHLIKFGKLYKVDLFAVVSSKTGLANTRSLIVFSAKSGIRYEQIFIKNTDIEVNAKKSALTILRGINKQRKINAGKVRFISFLPLNSIMLSEKLTRSAQITELSLMQAILQSSDCLLLERSKVDHIIKERKFTSDKSNDLLTGSYMIQLEAQKSINPKLPLLIKLMAKDLSGKELFKLEELCALNKEGEAANKLSRQIATRLKTNIQPVIINRKKEATRFLQLCDFAKLNYMLGQASIAARNAYILDPTNREKLLETELFAAEYYLMSKYPTNQQIGLAIDHLNFVFNLDPELEHSYEQIKNILKYLGKRDVHYLNKIMKEHISINQKHDNGFPRNIRNAATYKLWNKMRKCTDKIMPVMVSITQRKFKIPIKIKTQDQLIQLGQYCIEVNRDVRQAWNMDYLAIYCAPEFLRYFKNLKYFPKTPKSNWIGLVYLTEYYSKAEYGERKYKNDFDKVLSIILDNEMHFLKIRAQIRNIIIKYKIAVSKSKYEKREQLTEKLLATIIQRINTSDMSDFSSTDINGIIPPTNIMTFNQVLKLSKLLYKKFKYYKLFYILPQKVTSKEEAEIFIPEITKVISHLTKYHHPTPASMQLLKSRCRNIKMQFNPQSTTTTDTIVSTNIFKRFIEFKNKNGNRLLNNGVEMQYDGQYIYWVQLVRRSIYLVRIDTKQNFKIDFGNKIRIRNRSRIDIKKNTCLSDKYFIAMIDDRILLLPKDLSRPKSIEIPEIERRQGKRPTSYKLVKMHGKIYIYMRNYFHNKQRQYIIEVDLNSFQYQVIFASNQTSQNPIKKYSNACYISAIFPDIKNKRLLVWMTGANKHYTFTPASRKWEHWPIEMPNIYKIIYRPDNGASLLLVGSRFSLFSYNLKKYSVNCFLYDLGNRNYLNLKKYSGFHDSATRVSLAPNNYLGPILFANNNKIWTRKFMFLIKQKKQIKVLPPIQGRCHASVKHASYDGKFVIISLSGSHSKYIIGELKSDKELLKLPGVIDISPRKSK